MQRTGRMRHGRPHLHVQSVRGAPGALASTPIPPSSVTATVATAIAAASEPTAVPTATVASAALTSTTAYTRCRITHTNH